MRGGREHLGRAERWERGADADASKVADSLGDLAQGVIVLVIIAQEGVLPWFRQRAGGVQLLVQVRDLLGDVAHLATHKSKHAYPKGLSHSTRNQKLDKDALILFK